MRPRATASTLHGELKSARRACRQAAIGLTIAAVTLAGCGGDSGTPRAGSTARRVPYDAPLTVSPPRPAPPTSLRNYDGRKVSLAGLRGKAVLITFVYTHCPDTCPLIVSKLRTVQALLGRARSRVQVVAVSTDPAQDTAGAVRHFLAARGMLGRMDYLLGSRSALERVWSSWGVAAKRVSPKPADVEHSAMIYGVAANGSVTTIYPANFKPRWMVHDVPLLASQ